VKTTTTAAAGGTGGVGIGVLIVWLVGYLGVEMTAEVGAIVGGLATAAGGAIGAYGLVGIAKRIWRGAPPPPPGPPSF
jgi:hypothetical protein